MFPTFNRFDICEAYNLLAHDFGLYDVKARLDRLGFRCGPSREYYANLDENGKAIYDRHAEEGCRRVRSRFR